MARPRVTYLEKFSKIKSFVSFSYSKKYLQSKRLNRKQKYKLTRYYNEVERLQARPYQKFASKSSKKLHEALKYSGHNLGLKQFKAALVPTGGIKAKVKFDTEGQIEVIQKHVKTKVIYFDHKQTVIDPKGYTKKKLKGIKAKNFNIMASAYEIPSGQNRDSLPDKIQQLYQRYGQERHSNGKKNWHFIGDWFLGVRAIYTRQQSTATNFIGEKKKHIEEYKSIMKNRRLKERRNKKDKEIKELKAQVRSLKSKLRKRRK